MSTSILNDVKHVLGILPEDTTFDLDVMLHINTTLGTLTQLGVGPMVGYEITGKDNLWSEFFTDPRLNSVKSYIYLRVKLLFDNNMPGPMLASMERQIDELSYRINVVAEYDGAK